MGAKKTKEQKDQEAKKEAELKAKRELFCQYYAKNSETFGNATWSYAYAFGYELDELSEEGVYEQIENDDGSFSKGELIEKSPYDRACAVCATEGGKLLRKPEIQARIVTLRNELLRDEIVDSELVKVIQQDNERGPKVRAINEYNKVRGRIVDKTQNIGVLPFGETDLSIVIATLPQERQEHWYAIIRELIAEAELPRGTSSTESGVTR